MWNIYSRLSILSIVASSLCSLVQNSPHTPSGVFVLIWIVCVIVWIAVCWRCSPFLDCSSHTLWFCKTETVCPATFPFVSSVKFYGTWDGQVPLHFMWSFAHILQPAWTEQVMMTSTVQLCRLVSLCEEIFAVTSIGPKSRDCMNILPNHLNHLNLLG